MTPDERKAAIRAYDAAHDALVNVSPFVHIEDYWRGLGEIRNAAWLKAVEAVVDDRAAGGNHDSRSDCQQALGDSADEDRTTDPYRDM